MFKPKRLLTLLGGAAAALGAAFAMAAPSAHAVSVSEWPGGGPYETCSDAVCLVMGDTTPTDWHYGGLRPFFTQWVNNTGQEYTVQAIQSDGSAIDAGHYDIKISDTWTPFGASYVYEYGDFIANADAPSGLDLGWFGDLSGATVYDTEWNFFGIAGSLITINNVGPHDVSYIVSKFGDFTNTFIYGTDMSADYIQFGDADPTFLWNTLFHPGFENLQVPDWFIPADPFMGPDFNPGDYIPVE